MRTRNSVRGKVAVVTGAGSGIGRQLALELARRGARLALCDVDQAGLAATAGLVRAAVPAVGVHTARLDVSDRLAVEAYAADVVAHHGVVHQVYNNAGVSGGGQSVLDSDWRVVERTLAVNLYGVLHGTRAFLPHLVASGDGHVVNVSSLNGFFAQAKSGDYCASKFAVRGLTESLRAEVLADRLPVRVTVVHPGGVRTRIASAGIEEARRSGVELTPDQLHRARTYEEKLLRMPADRAARTVLDGVEAGRSRILVGGDAKAVDLLVRLFPASAPVIANAIDRRVFGAG
ncbi:SDR family NAD(P)-dependent oxidoreductase [Kineococcus sp. R8]|uniref:SDR family NAD(P)-dependent oxidoreductase n=1 Tax=Kineococcus siccus TaxID=2696567 RepID=UPI0014126C92|nr:SDR family NAD(P)-dependent oxidoreductase [Kineococcus siccus]NAZ81814.1 SDR family NAD(P)-dependent oxidoreductase [Kineococcus siccus]